MGRLRHREGRYLFSGDWIQTLVSQYRPLLCLTCLLPPPPLGWECSGPWGAAVLYWLPTWWGPSWSRAALLWSPPGIHCSRSSHRPFLVDLENSVPHLSGSHSQLGQPEPEARCAPWEAFRRGERQCWSRTWRARCRAGVIGIILQQRHWASFSLSGPSGPPNKGLKGGLPSRKGVGLGPLPP